MASDKAITNALLEAVRDIYAEDIDKLSVNYVRRVVEEKLGLEEGALKEEGWKGRSKETITAEVARLDEQGPPQSSPAPQPKAKAKAKPAPAPKVTKKPEPPKKGTKRAAPAKAEPRKRQKKEATPSSEDEEVSELESEEETPSDSEEIEAPRGKKRAPARGGKKEAKKGRNDESQSEKESELSSAEDTASEVESEVSEGPKAKKPANGKPVGKQAPKRAATGSRKSTERVDSEDEGEDVVAPAKPKPAATTKAKSESVIDLSDVEDAGKADPLKPAAGEDSDSDLSVLIDEPPRRNSKSKVSKPATSKPSKPSTALSPAAAELKTLQSQLLKCGIRKIWQFELKEYGDDTKAKIAHLKRMLRDAGMQGRFSEARAKEIKEMRELEQDLEFVKEGARLWGKSGRRSDAAKAKVQAEGDGDEEEEEGDEESEEAEEEVKPTARMVARAKADLAFLGEESDSDSD